MVPLLVAGTAMGVGSSVANYMGGKKEAKRRQGAIDAYGRTSADLYEKMAKDAWDQGLERQRGTGRIISGLTDTMGQPATEAPQTSAFLPTVEPDTTGMRGDEYQRILQSAALPQAQVDQANLNATQAGLDRGALSRALQQLGFSSTIEGQAKDVGHKRYQWQRQRELEEAKARLEAVLGSIGNSTQKLQLLGSILGTGSQAAMLGASFAGSPTAGVPNAGAATYGGGATPGPYALNLANTSPSSISAWL